jgi:TrmH family RNA methyltransferase
MPTTSIRPGLPRAGRGTAGGISRVIHSRQNARVKELRSGFARAGVTDEGRIAVEGQHLVGEAIAGGLPIAAIFIEMGREALLDNLAFSAETEILSLPPEVFSSAVRTDAPQGIAALVVPPSFTLDQVLAGPTPLLMVSAGLQDPGNLGTLIRSAEAFGATGFVSLPGTVSLYNQKALRASAGSIFRLPAVAAKAEELFAALSAREIPTLAAVAADGEPLTQQDLSSSCTLILGNEGNGIPEEVLRRVTKRVTIPMPGPVESLNAAIAGSILLYEAARQRGLR